MQPWRRNNAQMFLGLCCFGVDKTLLFAGNVLQHAATRSVRKLLLRWRRSTGRTFECDIWIGFSTKYYGNYCGIRKETQRPSRIVSEKLNSNYVIITKMKTFSRDRVNQFGFLLNVLFQPFWIDKTFDNCFRLELFALVIRR